jgi:uncharacterized secreted protein with C-terminal beta-propeller domain
VPGDDAVDFLSHVPGESAVSAADAGTASSTEAPAAGAVADSDSASRAIAEADIVQREGDTLYALSRYAGLSVIDISQPENLRLLGRHRSTAKPFEMYVRGGVAYILYNQFGRYTFDEVASAYTYKSSSYVSALDVRDPANMMLIGSEEVPGDISDSRLVGDVLYLVTFEDGYCWNCDTMPNTRVASFDVSNPAHFDKVDELRFEEQSLGGYRRSIAVNTQRIYVAGPTWSDRDSNIQVVDIANPAGDLALGASIPLHGSVQSRWQMDEFDGVLRVISQPTAWRTIDPPYVQTFRVESSAKVTPLASVPVRLPRPESLQSVRFDGPRAYAVTFQQTDPLFTFDLTDPAAPEQVGELEIPGFVYHMEPRGDRIYALGYDLAQDRGALHVSIFDVSNLAAPRLLDRVNFGGDWASLAEDQDRIQKAFNILLDQGLILVPFSGGTYDSAHCNYRYKSGIQLIDVSDDKLALRGIAPQVGSARRAFVHRQHLFGVTDNALSVFDIADRDAPAAVADLEVARNISQVHVMGGTLLRFGIDWWTSRSVLDFTTLAGSDTAEPLGEIDLSAVLDDGEQHFCGGSAYWEGQLYVHGDVAYAPRRSYRYEASGIESTLSLYVLDLHDRSAPKVVGKIAASTEGDGEYLGGVVLTESALLIGRGKHPRYFSTDGTVKEERKAEYAYDIFDLKDPLAPAFTQRFQVPGWIADGGWGHGFVGCGVEMGWGDWFPGTGSSGALVSGDVVVSQHEEAADDESGRVRYYLDRLDVHDPSNPALLPEVNIPGQVVHFDGEGQRLLTLDYVATSEPGLSSEECYGLSGRSYPTDEDGCTVYRRRANALVLEGNKARRVSMVDLDTAARTSGSIAVSGQRLFVTTGRERRWDGTDEAPEVRMESFAFATSGELTRLAPVELDDNALWSSLYARGARAFISTSGRLSVVDTRNAETPSVSQHDMQGWGCDGVEVDGDVAYCALDQYGVARIALE